MPRVHFSAIPTDDLVATLLAGDQAAAYEQARREFLGGRSAARTAPSNAPIAPQPRVLVAHPVTLEPHP